MKYKYKIGDELRIIIAGRGYSVEGEVVTVLELGNYNGEPGYRTTVPKNGTSNAQTGEYKGMAGESSFVLHKLAEETELYPIY